MNKHEKMSFREYIFKNNPSLINITHQRKTALHNVPMGDDNLQELGCKNAVIEGKGEFFGEDCLQSFEELKSVFLRGGSGVLCLPGMTPVLACFARLELVGEPLDNMVKYEFTFYVDNKNVDYVESNRKHICNGSECLWDIAYKQSEDIERLVKKNPDIIRPDTVLEEGCEVLL